MERFQIVRRILILILLNLLHPNVSAQELIFEKRPDTIQVHPNYGPNHKHFVHPFISSSVKTNQILAGQLSLGFRYKLKFSRPFSVVSEVGLSSDLFRLSKKAGLYIPDSISHLSQSVKSSGFFGGLYIRTRLGQKGDYLGNFIDIGLSGGVNFLNKLITSDTTISGTPGSLVSERTSRTNFKNINPLLYSACIRIGFDKFSLIASYRLSQLLKTTIGKDLPALQVGLEISPIRY